MDGASLIPHWSSSCFSLDELASWDAASYRVAPKAPVRKTTPPLVITNDIPPSSSQRLSANSFFFDFGTERMAGLKLTVPASSLPLLGGTGSTIEVKLSEELSENSSSSILYPGHNGCRYVSKFTVGNHTGDADQVFEVHEYIGLFRYAEVTVTPAEGNDQPAPASIDLIHFSLAIWAVSYPWADEASFVSSDSTLDAV